MEDSTPVSGSFDKSRVMNVRPLRCLVPIFGSASAPNFPSFPNPQGGAPFVCVSPSGPFPPGAASFYPFFATPEPQRPPVPNRNAPISNAVPITSFRTPQTQYAGDENGETGSSRRVTRSRALSRHQSGDVQEDGQYSSSFSMHDSEDTGKAGRSKSSSRSQRRTRARQDINIASTEIDIDSVIENLLASSNIAAFDMIRRAEADKESVECLLMIYDFIRRKINQIEESKDAVPGVTRRPDLRAGAILMNKGIRTNIKKRVGVVPGVEVGDCFFFRMELCLIGLHAPCMAGIDYMGLKVSQSEEPLAVSIVSSGGYEDDNMEDGGVLIYSGQGGNHFRKDKEVMDQKLERGNLALEKSLHRGNEIRVIRGFKDFANPTGKVYVYDGLYKIQESWVDKGKSGRNVFKYKLVRLPGQPEAFMTWKLIQQWKDGVNSRVGVILPDLTSGAESAPVSLVNDVDDEKGPAYFTYFPGLKNEKPVDPTEPCTGCICVGGCLRQLLVVRLPLSIHPHTKRVSFLVYFSQIIEIVVKVRPRGEKKERKKAKLNTMAASLQAAATLMQPTKVGVVSSRSSLQLRSSQTVSKSFGVEPAAARLTCSLQADIKDFAQKCVDASKIAGFALATSALVVSGAGAEGVPKRLTYDEIQSKTYMEVKGTGTANQCPSIDGGVDSFSFKPGKYNAKKICLEPTSFTVKAEVVNKNAPPEFQNTKLMTRLTYTLDEIEGPFEVSPDGTIKFEEKDGIDYAAVTVQLPGGERVPFLFTIKQLVASGKPDGFGGQFLVPSYRGSSFLDPKGRGGSTGYDSAVALPAGGRGDEEELAKENVKNTSSSTGKITLRVTKSKPETGELIGVFESIQPSDTDMGAKVPKEVKIQGIWYAQLDWSV